MADINFFAWSERNKSFMMDGRVLLLCSSSDTYKRTKEQVIKEMTRENVNGSMNNNQELLSDFDTKIVSVVEMWLIKTREYKYTIEL